MHGYFDILVQMLSHSPRQLISAATLKSTGKDKGALVHYSPSWGDCSRTPLTLNSQLPNIPSFRSRKGLAQ